MPILIIIAAIGYINTKKNILYNANIAINQSKNSIINTIKLIEENYEFASSYYDPIMKEALEMFQKEYKKYNGNVSELNLNKMKEKYNGLLDFYIIDSSGIIRYSTFDAALGIDFKEEPEFYNQLTKVRNGNEIQISKVTSELRTYQLRKWGYCPTYDHKYVLEVGISAKELNKYIKKIDYIEIEKEVKKINPYVHSILVYDRQYFILGSQRCETSKDEIKIIDNVISNHKNYSISNELGISGRDYLYVDTFSSVLDDSKKVVRIEYDYSSINNKINYVYKCIVTIIVIYMLLSFIISSYIIYKFITRPLVNLSKSVKEMSIKKLNVQVEVDGQNEIAQLAESFNEMSISLYSTFTSITNLENIINSVGDIFIIVDKNFRIRRINKYALNLLGYDLETIKNQYINILFDETFNVQIIVDRIEKSGGAENIENKLIKADSSYTLVESVFTALKDEEGKTYGYTCISKDISKTKEEIGRMEEINKKLKTEEKILREKNAKDWLTGIYNREYIFTYLRELILTRSDVSIILCDIDHFKKVNDTYGHPKGDIVLKGVASIIKENLRYKDAVGRYGGEEFLIVLPRAYSDEAYKIFERIRKVIQNTSFSDEKIKITISGGIAELDETNIDEFIALADKRLYKAKSSGRNCGIKN